MSGYFWGAFFILAILGISISGAGTIFKFMEMRKECNLNSDCGADSFCGSDFKCHKYPVIENTIVKNDWTTPAAIIGLSVVLSALILRKRRSEPRQFY